MDTGMEQLIGELHRLVADAEALLDAAGGHFGAAGDAAVSRLG